MNENRRSGPTIYLSDLIPSIYCRSCVCLAYLLPREFSSRTIIIVMLVIWKPYSSIHESQSLNAHYWVILLSNTTSVSSGLACSTVGLVRLKCLKVQVARGVCLWALDEPSSSVGCPFIVLAFEFQIQHASAQFRKTSSVEKYFCRLCQDVWWIHNAVSCCKGQTVGPLHTNLFVHDTTCVERDIIIWPYQGGTGNI